MLPLPVGEHDSVAMAGRVRSDGFLRVLQFVPLSTPPPPPPLSLLMYVVPLGTRSLTAERNRAKSLLNGIARTRLRPAS